MFKDYFLLTKPRICFLILVTAYLGYYLGLRSVGLFMISISEWMVFSNLMFGTLFSCAGACALNQAIEYQSDAKMDRTKKRPVPSGKINPKKAFIFGFLLSIIGIFYLYFTISFLVSFLSFLTVFSYIVLYTPLKKKTSLNTLVGAVPGALPPVGGWFAANTETSSIVVALFAMLFCWQIPHFLALAYMYSEDYKKGGFVMLPSLYSNQIQTRIHMLFFTLLLLFITFYLYMIKVTGIIYLFGAIILSFMFMYSVIKFSFTVNRQTARGVFFSSIIYLPVILILVIINS